MENWKKRVVYWLMIIFCLGFWGWVISLILSAR